MNSGSESVTLAFRISDVNAKTMTDKGGRHEGKKIKILSFEGGFHGRTDKPAHASDSSMGTYKNKLASFRDHNNLVTVEPNNVAKLEEAFKEADEHGYFIEMALFEPCMGEGNPGVGITREFFDKARELTKAHGSLLLIDSIQAGIRAHGCLSICDYPGFQDAEAPDLETFSKAVNAGQYPLSILAVNSAAKDIYQRGIYGNTMTANPRALEVGCAVLDNITPEFRKNIQDRGLEFIEKFNEIKEDFPGVVSAVTGTGLLCAIHLSDKGYQVVGDDGVELYMRKYGIGVIHGGTNALRFTPHFNISSEEIGLICDVIRDALNQGPIYK
jgi:acetylornithine/succinyldiaminopimelate/putrescine aminotransferase